MSAAPLETPPRAGYFPGDSLPKNWGKWFDKEDLSIWDLNPPRRQLSDLKYRETRDSMAAEGQVEPVVVQFDLTRSPTLVDGNRRLRAADELGWRKLWAVELPLDKDPTRNAAIRNMKSRAWTTHELMALALHDPSVIDQLNPHARQFFERLRREVPEADALNFASRYSVHTIAKCSRICEYTGATLAYTIRYVLTQPVGILPQLDNAIKMHIPSHRLKVAIEEGLPPEMWWREEDA